MIPTWYQNFPLHISPIAFMIGPFAVRWYALSYIVGFSVVYLLLMRRINNEEINKIARIFNLNFLISDEFSNEKRVNLKRLLLKSKNKKEIQNTKYKIQDTILDFLLITFFSSLIGGRIGYVIFYNWKYFLQNSILIFWPFEKRNFVGFFGMSFHGALIAAIFASWLFLKKKKINFWQWADFIVPAVPLGYFFGRVGNFLNGELYGRITNSFWGVHFISDPNNLRYPSQLIEAILEGLLLFLLLWFVRNKKIFQGKLLALYLVGYSFFRIIGELFRDPDPQLGFIFFHLTMGQLLSLIMMSSGIILFFFQKRKKVVYLDK